MTSNPRHDGSPSSRRRRTRAALPAVAALLAVVVVVVVILYRDTLGPDNQVQRYPRPAVPAATSVPARPGVVRPEDFGAVGDGVHDDGPALQDALDQAHGRTVVLRSGATYLSSRSLRMPSHTTMVGTSTSVLAFSWEHTTDPDSGGGYYLGNADQVGGNVDIVLKGFAIKGAGDGLPAGPMDPTMRNVPALRLRHVNTFRVHGLDVGFSPGISILYQGCSHGVLDDNHVHDSGRDGITGTAEGDVLADIDVVDNLVERVGDDGIAVAGATARIPNSKVLPTDIEIRGNRIEGWTKNPNGLVIGRGIALLAVTDVRVVDNTVARTASEGILVRGAPSPQSVNPLTKRPWVSSNVTITGNRLSGIGAFAVGSTLPSSYTEGNGIEADRAQYVDASGNSIQVERGQDVVTQSCLHCDVAGG